MLGNPPGGFPYLQLNASFVIITTIATTTER